MLFESKFPEIKGEIVIKRYTSSILLQALEFAAFVCGFPKPMEMDVFYARVWHSSQKRPSKTTTMSRVLLAINLANETTVKLAVEHILVEPRTHGAMWMYEVTFQDVKTGKSLPPIPFWCHPGDAPGTTPDYDVSIEEIQEQVKWLQKQKRS